MINDKIAVLEKWIKGETEEGKPLDLLLLLESAVYLGAERIKSVLEELTEKTGKSEEEMRNFEYRLLLKEFEILRDALPSSTPKQVPDVKKQNQKKMADSAVFFPVGHHIRHIPVPHRNQRHNRHSANAGDRGLRCRCPALSGRTPCHDDLETGHATAFRQAGYHLSGR